MPTNLQVSEGGPIMDPASPAFQEMLLAAQTRASEKASGVTDEKQPGEASSASSTESTADETVAVTPEDANPETLKQQISGLQAELARVRKQRTGSTDEAQGLKERLANMEGQLSALKQGSVSQTVENKIQALNDDELIENHVLWVDEQTDARIALRTAERDRDQGAITEAAARLATARKMSQLYDKAKQDRVVTKGSQREQASLTEASMKAELDGLFEGVHTAIPEMRDQTSEIWLAGQAEYKAMPVLMARLGPLGELIATASAIAKNPNLVSKKAAAKLTASIEKAAEKAFQKGGAALAPAKSVTSITSAKDVSDFEAQVAAIKMG